MADLFTAPKDWVDGFDFVLESYTLQVLPPNLTKNELEVFQTSGLKEISFKDYVEDEDPPVRRFRATDLLGA